MWQVFLQEIHQPFYNYFELRGKIAAITFSHPKVLHGGEKKRLEHLIIRGWRGGVGGMVAAENGPEPVPGKEKSPRVYLGDVCRLEMGKSTPACAVIRLNNKHNWNKISWKFLRF